VAGEVPGFVRGGRISDAGITNWMGSVAQQINAALLRRGLPLTAADWQPVIEAGAPSPADLLELLNRLGAAALLAAAIGGQFGAGEWGLAKALERRFERELKALEAGAYDKVFRPAAATIESGTLFGGGDTENDAGETEPAFEKEQEF
jgi:hypothetical protein